MYERMLDKSSKPDLSLIREYIGENSYALMCSLESSLSSQYDLSKELRFPFGNHYGWGYKYSHRSFHLCYVFFEKGAITVTIQIGDRQVAALQKVIDNLTPKAKELWTNRYLCGDIGGWIHYRILNNSDLSDIIQFIKVKKAPILNKTK